jgi:D-serine deaminase-like pyridoxal phosphate-dependent protein
MLQPVRFTTVVFIGHRFLFTVVGNAETHQSNTKLDSKSYALGHIMQADAFLQCGAVVVGLPTERVAVCDSGGNSLGIRYFEKTRRENHSYVSNIAALCSSTDYAKTKRTGLEAGDSQPAAIGGGRHDTLSGNCADTELLPMHRRPVD